jgi:hypothetical protein
VKTRLKESVQQTKDQAVDRVRAVRAQATDDEGRPTPTTLGVGGGIAVAVVVVIALTLWRRQGR